MRYADLHNQDIPQSEPLDEQQVENNAGGFVYQIDDWGRLARFLILGSDGGTYYQSARKLTKENTAFVSRCYDLQHLRTINQIVTISQSGRAPKNDAAIWALAVGAAHKLPVVRTAALSQLGKVCRTATHLFQFVTACDALERKWGRAMKRAIAQWYNSRDVDSVAYQLIKYRARSGYNHKRLLELAHVPALPNSPRQALYRWAKNTPTQHTSNCSVPAIVTAHMHAMAENTKPKQLIGLIKEYGLPWEAIPTSAKKIPEVWEAMLPFMGMTALIRNLGTMTACGTLKPLSNTVRLAIARLSSSAELQRARIHPFSVLVAAKAYHAGVGRMHVNRITGERTQLTWLPVPSVERALEQAFYNCFKFVEPTRKNTLIALDVSGSMTFELIRNTQVSACAAGAAMAMVTARAEQNYHIMAFDEGLRELPINPSMSLAEVMEHTADINGGGTDCALPMLEALRHGWTVDTFVVITDNETWSGHVHPMEALRKYRKKTGINAKLVVIGMTATDFSIADPQDPGALDVVGFDANAPTLIADFSRGQAATGTVTAEPEDDFQD